MNDLGSSYQTMERRSTRLSTHHGHLAEALDIKVDSEYEQPLTELPTRARKRKACEDKNSKVGPQAKKIRGKRGMLRQLVEMPLDVLFEIFGHLKPLDLLHLARTTKDLRAILMNRSSTSIWKLARSHFCGLPDCPDDLSEPQYAELLFGKACNYCHRNVLTNTVIWTSRVRTCSRCFSVNFSQHVISFNRQLLEYVQVKTLVKSRRRSSREKFVYPLELIERWRNEHSALPTLERADWVVQKIKELEAVKTHATLCEIWEESMKQAQEMEKTALMDHRKAIIMERVKTLGWADELSKMNSFARRLEDDSHIEKICQKDVTARVLNQLDEFINIFMGRIKSRRLQREREIMLQKRLPILRKIYDACVATYPVGSIIPCSADVFLDPFVQNLILNPSLTATFTEQSLETVGAAFPDIVLRWRKETEEKLLNMISTENASKSIFQLATTIFSCKHCDARLTYPRVLVHCCATKHFYHSSDEDLSIVMRYLDCSYWNYGNLITFEVEKIALVAEAIKLCGLDPMSATGEDMVKLDPIFECLSCNDAREGRCMLSWPGLFSHIRRQHTIHMSNFNKVDLKLVDDETAANVREKMAEKLSRERAQKLYHGLCCTYCKLVGDSVTLSQHVNKQHDKPEPGNEDIVPVLDHNHFQVEYRLWPPNPVDGLPHLTIV